jgi:hypothetical protein
MKLREFGMYVVSICRECAGHAGGCAAWNIRVFVAVVENEGFFGRDELTASTSTAAKLQRFWHANYDVEDLFEGREGHM